MPAAPTIHSRKLVSTVWVMSLRGEHDVASAGELSERLGELVVQGLRVILDLSQTEFIDSAIVHTILESLPADGEPPHVWVVAGGDSAAFRVFALSGVSGRIPLCDSLPLALAWIGVADWDSPATART
jgi:anti-anti-sigma regulatory factor